MMNTALMETLKWLDIEIQPDEYSSRVKFVRKGMAFFISTELMSDLSFYKNIDFDNEILFMLIDYYKIPRKEVDEAVDKMYKKKYGFENFYDTEFDM